MCVLKKPTCDSVVNPLSLEGAQILSPIANGHSLLVVLETAQVEASDEVRCIGRWIRVACAGGVGRAVLTEEAGPARCSTPQPVQCCACCDHFGRCCCSVPACGAA